MSRSIARVPLMASALLLLVAGCSRSPESLTAPSARVGPAPLIAAGPGAHAVPGSYIVVLEDHAGTTDAIADELTQRHGFWTQQRYRTALHGFAARLTPSALALVRRDPRVAYIEEDQVVTIDAVQTDPPNWGLDRLDQPALPLDHRYDANLDGTGVDAYVVDTGILLTHEDFGTRAVTGFDAITPQGQALDANGHGTHVASTIGGTRHGVAKSVKLIAVRVLDANGSGTMSGVIAGVDWVTADHTTHPAVANLSLGGGASTTLDDAVKRAIADGVVFCVAAGNSRVNCSSTSPARVPEAITVAACDASDRFASFSNYGAGVDVIAPGVGITAAWPTSASATNTISGTSMATPHVAGVAAQILQTEPTATPGRVADVLVAWTRAGAVGATPSRTPNRLLQRYTGTPLPPTLTLPRANAKSQAPTLALTWQAIPGATGYRVELATDASFTIEYDVVTKFGGLTTTAIVAIDPILGKSVEIGDTRFLYTAEGTTSTCTVSTGECSNGIDETRVSDRQLTSTFFAQSAMERIRQDARVAVGPANGYASTTAERPTTCADFTVVDSTGASRTKTYCAFDALSVIAVLDTADLSITATTVTDTIDTARFQPPG